MERKLESYVVWILVNQVRKSSGLQQSFYNLNIPIHGRFVYVLCNCVLIYGSVKQWQRLASAGVEVQGA